MWLTYYDLGHIGPREKNLFIVVAIYYYGDEMGGCKEGRK